MDDISPGDLVPLVYSRIRPQFLVAKQVSMVGRDLTIQSQIYLPSSDIGIDGREACLVAIIGVSSIPAAALVAIRGLLVALSGRRNGKNCPRQSK